MFERILMPLDGSEVAEIALPYGEELASRLGSELVLYHVYRHEDQQQEHMHQMYLERLAEKVQSNMRNSKIKVTTTVEAGEPSENICNLVEKNRVDLMVMTAVSASGLRIGKMIGSVTDHICRTVPVPVMLIRPKNGERSDKNQPLLRRMLIPIDGSELSKQALTIGEELAAKLNLSATLYQMATMLRAYNNVVGYPNYDGSTYPVATDYLTFNEQEKNRVNAEMSALEKELKGQGFDVTSAVTSGFDAAYEIIELSKKIDIDLVVMSTRGRTGLGRWVLGNVAEKVLRHGQTPLLLVHARAG